MPPYYQLHASLYTAMVFPTSSSRCSHYNCLFCGRDLHQMNDHMNSTMEYPTSTTNSTLNGAPTDWMRLRLLLIVTQVMAVSAHLRGSAPRLTLGDRLWQVVGCAVAPTTALRCETLPEWCWQRGRLWNKKYVLWYTRLVNADCETQLFGSEKVSD